MFSYIFLYFFTFPYIFLQFVFADQFAKISHICKETYKNVRKCNKMHKTVKKMSENQWFYTVLYGFLRFLAVSYVFLHLSFPYGLNTVSYKI